MTTCLCMIVKNESMVLGRCFESLKDKIDYWVISDTGSTDGTQELIRNWLKDIPGELHEHGWVDFATNRNYVLELAHGKSDGLLMHDADETLEGDWSGLNPEADAHAFYLFVGDARNVMCRVFRGDLAWRYHGEMHEHPDVEGRKVAFLKTMRNYSHRDGARSR